MSPELKKWFRKNKVDLWKGLPYWKTGEWQVVKEKLKDLTKAKVGWNPGYDRLFRSMDLCPLEDCKVCILGQDPYPSTEFATGLAFDIGDSKDCPGSMSNILKELASDLRIEHTGNLEGWARQGVLLWNVVPSCQWGKSLSHEWPEWEPLTCDVIKALNKKNIVFVVVGNYVKKNFADTIDHEENEVIYVGHPSPRNVSNAFTGSRVFSRVNASLRGLGEKEIDWSL